ncbi:MAG TPA: hypothetical protein VFI23_02460 [Rhizomicrobium sp.]|nr:hypothetical protein [Rhizomicrobium sp.]
MPNLDFYAASLDFQPVLDFIFNRSGCRVFESYSEFDAEIREFKSTNDLSQVYRIGECIGSSHSVYLQLVPPGADALYHIRRIVLKPSTGHKYRYSIEGWGLIQLYLGGLGPSGLVLSHTNHNSEKRANLWAHTYPEIKSPEAWDWKQVVRTSSAVNRYIRTKLAVSFRSSHPVLPEAAKALAHGIKTTF